MTSVIPCRVCEQDASTGWVIGFPPAPAGQKMGLCKAHDTPENRALVTKAWQDAQVRGLSRIASAAAHKAGDDRLSVRVRFTAGGLLEFTCRACFPTDHSTLCLESFDGERTFIPLEQIREYTVRPLAE